MHIGLLPIIYLAFVCLGFPSSTLGSAWPSMYAAIGANVSWVGVLTAIIAAATILSSVLSAWLVEKMGTGRLTVASVVMTAAAMVGFSLSGEFWQLCLWSVPFGLGSGAADAALNAYVAVHYASRHMNWLHCMWSVGASGGPVVMSLCLSRGTWSDGFRVIGLIQVAIAVVVTMSLPLWGRGRPSATEGARPADTREAGGPGRIGTRALLALPGVREVLAGSFCYNALESTCGIWAASYCALGLGISAEQGASYTSLFYLGTMAGRLVSGFLSIRLSDKAMIRLGQGLVASGVLLLALRPAGDLVMVALVVIGCGCAPIYPSIVHETPRNFGEENALALTGIQFAVAFLGTLSIPPLFGLVAEAVGFGTYPAALGIIVAAMFLLVELANRKVGESRRQAVGARIS